jgi:hypothetical protein
MPQPLSDYHAKRAASGVYNKPPEAPRNVTDLATGQVAVTSTPKQINYVNNTRIGTKLTNLSTTQVFYGSTPGVTAASGDLLPAGVGSWIFVPCRSVIFVVCAAGQNAQISWADAYD